MDFEVENQKNREKSVSKTMFFSIAFFYQFWEGLGRVWGGFWEGVGAFLASLGPLLASFFSACSWNALWEGSWRLLGWFWEGFGRGWGGVWEGSGRVWELKFDVFEAFSAITCPYYFHKGFSVYFLLVPQRKIA